MKKKLPVVRTPVVRTSTLAAKPVKGGSRPEFPTRRELKHKLPAALLATGLAQACGSPPQQSTTPAPDPAPAPVEATKPAEPPAPVEPAKPAEPVVAEPAPPPTPPTPITRPPFPTVNGQALAETAPKFKVYRDGGGIGPPEDMWEEEEVEAFINWTMAKEGKLHLETNYAFELDGVKLKLDAFDPELNIGYEYVDKLDSDADAMTKEVRAKLEAWNKEKKVAILFIEVKKNPDAATLKGKVVKFLNAVKKSPPAPKKP